MLKNKDVFCFQALRLFIYSADNDILTFMNKFHAHLSWT